VATCGVAMALGEKKSVSEVGSDSKHNPDRKSGQIFGIWAKASFYPDKYDDIFSEK
jgi:hypothetical protein